MRLAEWRFSAKLAWKNRFIKWVTIATVLVFVGMTAFILWRLIPTGLQTSVLTMHYTIYLGIDDVRQWQWIFAVPGLMLTVILINFLFALGIFRHDVLAAKMLVAFSAALTVTWCVGAFFLVLVNL
ncbi:MAG: hypothetical protein WA001_04375 [Patescibacteria group bacterium]